MTAVNATTAACLGERAGLPVLTWPVLDPLPVDAIVTTRQGGVSAGCYATLNLSLAVGDEVANVHQNRARAAAALGTGLAAFVFARQVHGRRAEVVSAADRGRGTLAADDAVGPADALVTATPGTVLAILVADCVPIVLYDPARRAPASEGDFLGIISLGCMMENMWLTAFSMGVGFHIVSSISAGPVEKEIKKLLEIPKHLNIAFSVRLGYPTGPVKYLRVRRDIEDFVHYNGFEKMYR